MSEPVIVLHELTKLFGSKHAVERLSLTVPGGAIYALLGENGAGKTTTIRMLTGQLPPDGGRATIAGHDCWRDAVPLRHRVGYVPERPRFYDWMTVGEIGWFTAGFHKEGYLDSYARQCQRFQLDSGVQLRHLSKGQYSKTALALALASEPEVLILDEPTSGLDLLVRREFLGSMVNLAAEGRTILISSHQIAEVERVASHVAFMAGGKLLLAATLDELRQRVVKLRLRFEQQPPDAGTLGTVWQRNGHGALWQAVVCDLDRQRLSELRQTTGIHDVEETALGLEEIYCALLERKEVRS